MNIEKYKHQHSVILNSIQTLRELSRLGVADNATKIAKSVITMSSVIKLHLSVEDNYLYPELQQSNDPALAKMGTQYQQEMTHIVSTYGEFAGKWNAAEKVKSDPEGFRRDANYALKILYERIQKEDRDFYPLVEKI